MEPSPCVFCKITDEFPPGVTSNKDSSSIVLYSDAHSLAFFDIMPLVSSVAHILVIPRIHYEKTHQMDQFSAQAVGNTVRNISEALVSITGCSDYNIVQNNGVRAGQVVPHVHYHIIMRGNDVDARKQHFQATIYGRGQREDLDEENAHELASKVRLHLKSRI